jgi:hypothetical protein
MSDKTKILVGLAIFILVAAFPVWRTFGASAVASRPELELPKEASRCVEDKDFMIANHMDLLNRWRDAVVREGRKVYTASTGETHDMSLTRTCMGMKCHNSRENFCKRCHDYANVVPTCWECHVTPEGS